MAKANSNTPETRISARRCGTDGGSICSHRIRLDEMPERSESENESEPKSARIVHVTACRKCNERRRYQQA